MRCVKSCKAVTRRQFLSTAAATTVAGLSVIGGSAEAKQIAIPLNAHTRRMHPGAWLPDPPTATVLRELALVAVDAARDAGAEFADVRIGVQRHVSVPVYPFAPGAGLVVGYGVRACVQGTWSFQHGHLLTVDAVATAARSAVAGARIYATVNAQLAAVGRGNVSGWAPAPVATGEWRVPVQVDPFAVPLDDYHRVLEALVDTTAPVYRNVSIGCIGLGWRAETRVFASTEGSLVTQETIRGGPGVSGGAAMSDGNADVVEVDVPSLMPTMGGFEVALRPEWIPQMLQGVDDAVRLRELPFRRFDEVGRFPIVFAGASFGKLIGRTVNLALDGDRASGIEANAAGGSFLAPVDEILGTPNPLFSPLLTMTADRAASPVAAMRWDDDGIVPKPYTVIDRGHVVDYHTTRETAPILADWYQRQGRQLRSNGDAVAPTPASVPMGSGGHLTVAPAAGRATLDDLVRDMPHGFLIRCDGASPDPGLTGGQVNTVNLVLEIQRGVPVARTNIHLQFTTKTILQKQLVALGDVGTVRTTDVTDTKGIPWQAIDQWVTAPAALCKNVDVIGAV